MRTLSWARVISDKSRCHLVVGRETAPSRGKAADRRMAYREQLVGQLVMMLRPAGDWSTATLRGADGGATVHIMFELKSDSDALAETGRASDVPNSSGWASRRDFSLTPASIAKILEFVTGEGERNG